MRLSPPITILAILTVAFAWLGLVNNITDCAYDPQGKLRWNHFGEWFQPDDDQQPACDVWQDIEPRKPIGIIEIIESSATLRIEPSGTVTIGLFPPNLSSGYFDGYGAPKIDDPKRVRPELRKFIVARSNPQIYDRVRALITPMRDYTGYIQAGRTQPSFLEDSPSVESRQFWWNVFYDLDDPRTKLGKCHGQISDSGAGWMVIFWDSASKQFQSISSYHDIGCVDVIARSGSLRVEQATRLIEKAIGAQNVLAAHREANRAFHP